MEFLKKWGWGGWATWGWHTIQDEGVSLPQRGKLNFVWTWVTATDGWAWPDSTIVTITSSPDYDKTWITLDWQWGVISTGIKWDIQIQRTGTITWRTLLADQAGTITIDTWKSTYAAFPPVVWWTIWATKPALSWTVSNTATWLTIAVTAGDILRFNVDTSVTCTRVLLQLAITFA